MDSVGRRWRGPKRGCQGRDGLSLNARRHFEQPDRLRPTPHKVFLYGAESKRDTRRREEERRGLRIGGRKPPRTLLCETRGWLQWKSGSPDRVLIGQYEALSRSTRSAKVMC